MAAPRQYPDESRERATRMAVEARRDPASSRGAIKRIADQLGIHPEALRTCAAGRDRWWGAAGNHSQREGLPPPSIPSASRRTKPALNAFANTFGDRWPSAQKY